MYNAVTCLSKKKINKSMCIEFWGILYRHTWLRDPSSNYLWQYNVRSDIEFK